MLYKIFIYGLKLLVYGFCLASSVVLAYALKYDFIIPVAVQKTLQYNIYTLVPLKILTLIALGEFKSIFSYFRLPDLIKIVTCFCGISFVLLLLKFCPQDLHLPSRDIIISDLLFSILFILFFRTSLRIVNNRLCLNHLNVRSNNLLHVAIYGTDESGSNIVTELRSKHFYGLEPVVIVDDDPKYYGRTLHEVPILGAPEQLYDFCRNHKLEGLILSTETLPLKRLNELTRLAQSLNLKILNIPSIQEFVTGHAFSTRLRTLDVEDFLERKPIHLNLERSQQQLEGRVVAITGAGGSIGRELSRQIAIKQPRQLILIEHSEYNLFKIQQDLLREGLSCVPVLLNITHQDDLKRCFERYKPEFVYHAAAYKHVPLLEDQPVIALKNNAMGTGILAKISSQFGVKRFTCISTDKAINPINNMGASKLISEMFCMEVQNQPGNHTEFMVVKFGNVLGSAGSVLPTFKEQIARGGPVTITHPEMTRFFMTIPEAVGLILEASSFDQIAQKTFILDMGKPVKILDVAKKMIELNNLRVGTDIEIVFTGIRPGEKIHEELNFDPDHYTQTENSHIWCAKDNCDYLSHLRPLDEYLQTIQNLSKFEDGIHFIRSLIPHFKQ